MLFLVGGSLAWVLVLRRHVALKTNQLREANESLHRISIQDALTGTANRRRFDEMIAMEVSRASRSSRPLSLIIADIDHFKAVNDLYGHPVGDHCLSEVARALKKSAPRITDLVCRYGGEEFAVILPDTGDEQAFALAESMRSAVEAVGIPNSASLFNGRLSISLGVATLWPGSAYSSDDLIGLADRALYHAKRNGRNCVKSWATVTLSV